MILHAYELGLGTCWIGAFKQEEAVKNILKIPKHVWVVATTPLGYSDEPSSPNDRKCLGRIVCFEKYE